MVSYNGPENPVLSGINNCTTASTFEKPNSLKFELLFGTYQEKTPQRDSGHNILDAFDYMFLPNQIFGFAYQSTGSDYKKLHHAFILRSCSQGETGTIIPGISPGAQILVKTLTSGSSIRLKSILEKLEKNSVVLPRLSMSDCCYINRLIEVNNNVDYFVGEMIDKSKKN